MKELPTRQKETYEYIKQFKLSYGFSPSQDEIGQHFMIAQQTVTKCLQDLKRKGFISYVEGKQRTITVLI